MEFDSGRFTVIKMYTTTWCGDCQAAKRALTSRGIPYEEINIEQDDQAAEYVMSVNGGRRSVPTLVAGDVAASLSGFRPQKLDAFLAQAGL
ncbi:mycoredoxin [Deinococcus metalli]|uniref:Mycoredoxin n=1 Tax=Deinococcus metalli TaxID=1141878 RepID=A0A7W8NT88_9DEIO|nr:mycoredoxin [Deinococcus metalli]GHF55028.1 NrdH-redoxin [Deinococcus metalli]